MKVIIDTSSLLALVRYYLPFDKSNVLSSFIEDKVLNKEIIILDKVYEECRYTSKGIVLENLSFISSKKNHVSSTDLLPNAKFFNLLEHNFINTSIKSKLSEAEFENRKSIFLESADAKILLLGLKFKGENIIVVSEETEFSNDNKAFKKLPAICKMLNIPFMTLPKFITTLQEINIQIK